MAFLRELKMDFTKQLVAYGIENPPQKELKQWVGKFRTPLPVGENFLPQRLANRFYIGCQPSVLMLYGGQKVSLAGLHVGKFGFLHAADECLRLQIPKQRSCLQLVAGLAKALRYAVGLLNPDVGVKWMAGTGAANNSLTGPVSFGRLGVNRVREVAALDAVYLALLQARVFDTAKNKLRLDGDSHYRRRGLVGDVVRHSFGYEYQSFPSFLESPFQALLVLTLAKLAVLSSEEVSNWLYVEGNAEAKILNLLAKYKGLDDDAKLVYWLISQQGFPRPTEDLVANWGAKADKMLTFKAYPPVELPIEKVWVDRVLALCKGEQVPPTAVKPFWKQTELAGTGYYTHSDPLIAKMLWGLKSKDAITFGLSENEALEIFGIPMPPRHRDLLEKKLGCSIRTLFKDRKSIYIPSAILQSREKRLLLREILQTKIFGLHEAGGKEVVESFAKLVKPDKKVLFQ